LLTCFADKRRKAARSRIEHKSQTNLIDNGYGIGNLLTFADGQLLENMRDVQKRHTLPLTDDLEGRHFCVEMETDTGKTYVYTKTIFELNRKYRFSKFIVVVPSVAIREGV
jgi:type III restriction enzyme